jgi:hypothetical protein
MIFLAIISDHLDLSLIAFQSIELSSRYRRDFKVVRFFDARNLMQNRDPMPSSASSPRFTKLNKGDDRRPVDAIAFALILYRLVAGKIWPNPCTRCCAA